MDSLSLWIGRPTGGLGLSEGLSAKCHEATAPLRDFSHRTSSRRVSCPIRLLHRQPTSLARPSLSVPRRRSSPRVNPRSSAVDDNVAHLEIDISMMHYRVAGLLVAANSRLARSIFRIKRREFQAILPSLSGPHWYEPQRAIKIESRCCLPLCAPRWHVMMPTSTVVTWM